jgi:hypothetical protein
MCANSRSTKPLASSKHVVSFSVAAAIVLMGLSAANAASITFGPQVFTGGSADSSGTRANFDLVTPATLSAGAYALTNFSFEAAQAGDAVPVLATVSGTAGSGTETYTIIAVGNDTSVSVTGFNSVAENATFVVPLGGENVYAGFVNETAQPVAFNGSGGNTDAHFDPGHNLVDGTPVVVGNTFVENGGNGSGSSSSTAAYELARTYQFSETVTALPEPSSIVALVGLCGMGLLLVVRRRRRRHSIALVARVLGLAAVCVLVSAPTLFAAPVFTNTSGTSIYTIPTVNDLLLDPAVTHIDRDGNGNVVSDTSAPFGYADGGQTPGSVAKLTDGSFGQNGTPTDGSFAGIVGAGSVNTTGAGNDTITYALDLAAHPQGYNISSIGIYTGWKDNGRSEIKAGVFYSTVASPNTFTFLGNVDYNGNVDNFSSLADSSGGWLATDVADIEFAFPGQENSGVGYRELTVIGAQVPEPSAIVALVGLCGMGLIGLIRYRRRKAA